MCVTAPSPQTETGVNSNRLNDEVPLFAGCTLHETLGVVGVSFCLSLMGTLPCLLVSGGQWTLGLAATLVCTVPLFFLLLRRLSRLKQGKPAGYYRQYLIIRLSQWGLRSTPYVMRSGKWATHRLFP